MQIWTVLGFALIVLGSPQARFGTSQNSSTSPTAGAVSAPAAGALPVPSGPAPPVPTGKPSSSEIPKPTPAANDGPICECGYTYCASVLKAMKSPWDDKQLIDAYCTTSHAKCTKGKPTTDIGEALFICLCGEEDQKIGKDLDLVCGCGKCLNTPPDFRGRCETPCL